MRSVKTAVVGYGNAGRIIHAPLVAAAAGLELAAIVSSNADKVKADWPGVTVIDDFDSALKDTSIELLVLATPNGLHAPQAIAAVEAGKHVVIDKPFATTLAEGQKIVDAAQSAGRIVSVFQNRRWDSHIMTLKSFLDEGKLGDVSEVMLRFDRLRRVEPQRWREQPLPGSGMWFDLGAHLVDQAVYLFGAPKTVMADMFSQRPGAVVPDYFNVILGYGTMRVIVHSSMISPVPGPVVEVQGTRGTFIKHGQDTQEEMLKARRTPGDAGWGIDPVAATFTPADGEDVMSPQSVICQPGNYLAYYEAMARTMRGEGAPPVTLTESLLVMRILETAIESAREGRRLALS